MPVIAPSVDEAVASIPDGAMLVVPREVELTQAEGAAYRAAAEALAHAVQELAQVVAVRNELVEAEGALLELEQAAQVLQRPARPHGRARLGEIFPLPWPRLGQRRQHPVSNA